MFLSGGTDSIACLDAALTAGVGPARIEWNHQDGDGSGPALMDGSVTASDCRAPAASIGLPLFRPGRALALTEPSARPAQQPWESMQPFLWCSATLAPTSRVARRRTCWRNLAGPPLWKPSYAIFGEVHGQTDHIRAGLMFGWLSVGPIAAATTIPPKTVRPFAPSARTAAATKSGTLPRRTRLAVAPAATRARGGAPPRK